jgi:hypothetical protein
MPFTWSFQQTLAVLKRPFFSLFPYLLPKSIPMDLEIFRKNPKPKVGKTR